MKLNRKLVLVVALVLSVAMATGGTLAYLTDRDSVANVFLMGDVQIKLNEDFEQGAELIPGVNIEKKPTITNTGKTDAWVWATIAIPAALDSDDASKNAVHFNAEGVRTATENHDGIEYNLYTVFYPSPLKPGETTPDVMSNVSMDSHVDIDPNGDLYWVEAGVATKLGWNINDNGNPTIYVSAYAMQTEGFDTVEDAYAAYTEQWTTEGGVNNGIEWGTPATITTVSTADELKAALAAGGNVVLTTDIEVDANTTITIASGNDVTLNLNGNEISAAADKTGNQELFLVKGNMTVKNGTVELTAENNQGWNAMATIFDVTSGGILNMDGVTANVSGTDMNFVVHLNNWGSATLNMNNCDLTSTYCAVRVFNGGYDMNNVTIENSDFHGGRMLWVHNYTSEGKDASTLNMDIYGNNNSSDHVQPVRFGFDASVYYDLNGNVI